ncbi:conserved hypothetical protein (plasmid) [Rhizobium leguminosarum bv. trifolii WSM2304]|uniref:DUF695 domain-containing protein n=1 Tax=Rhizobium leguminosarum bv. trifolii (strain WSM2304) TaxID=395492 RepID=A0ABF7QZX7_RHILW|nr:hypothetical protein [Rhizobium leguminosarum]ACI59577.1 conserved hypothetical protein [Rhizobium leguminosarum bv. trifolii WSM2304]
MSDDWYYVHQLAMLSGFKLVVLANRIGCADDFLLQLHDGLAEGLESAMARVRSIMALERQIASEPDEEGFAAFQLHGEEECFARLTIALLDDLEIDYATYEYRVNNGEWHYALSADCDGIEISYPSTIALTDAELGGLGPIIRGISHETGMWISAARIVYD